MLFLVLNEMIIIQAQEQFWEEDWQEMQHQCWHYSFIILLLLLLLVKVASKYHVLYFYWCIKTSKSTLWFWCRSFLTHLEPVSEALSELFTLQPDILCGTSLLWLVDQFTLHWPVLNSSKFLHIQLWKTQYGPFMFYWNSNPQQN